MPVKLLPAARVPTLVQERLRIWGQCIRTQRIKQHIQAADLCARMGVSDATLRRLEKGDPGAATGSYLNALLILGLLEDAVPMPDAALWTADMRKRARSTATANVHDADF